MVDTLPSGVQIQEQWSAVFYTKAADVPAMSNGLPRTYDGITIHWWGTNPDGSLMTSFDAVVATFCNGNKQTSAHYGAEDEQVACFVSPWDVAWACGNWEGNRTTISIECNPRGSDGDYARVAEVIKYLRDKYGDLPLIPHSHWVATDCPGTYDLNRLDQLARGTTPTPAPVPVNNIVEDEIVFFAQLPNDGRIFISNGIWYRYIETPQNQQDLINAGVPATVHQVVDLNSLGLPADYVTGPQFKADIFTGQSDVEKNSQADFINRVAGKVQTGSAPTVELNGTYSINKVS